MPSKITEAIKKKLKVDKLSKPEEGGGRSVAGDLKLQDIKTIAKDAGGDEGKAMIKMVLGTCVSCGVTVDGKDPREVQKEIDEGKIQI